MYETGATSFVESDELAEGLPDALEPFRPGVQKGRLLAGELDVACVSPEIRHA